MLFEKKQPEELPRLILEVNIALKGSVSRKEVALMLGTAAHESGGFQYRRQLGNGPARGLWQMEPGMTGAQDIFANYFRWKHALFEKFMVLCFDFPESFTLPEPWIPREADLAYLLENNDLFACALARVKYMRDPQPIPETLEGQAMYWKRVYNTPLGAGAPEQYIADWATYNCDLLMQEVT